MLVDGSHPPPDPPAQQPDWGLPSSYDALLAAERKRKVALSPPINGWVAGVESKEIVDFALILELSVAMQTDVIAVQLLEVTGSCGYALCSNGHVAAHRFSVNDDDPAGTITDFIERNGVRVGLISFKEAVQMRSRGWVILP